MKKILLDTNFLLIPVQFKVDIFSELAGKELYILDRTLDELKKIKDMKVALSLIKKNNVKIIKTEPGKRVDDLIIETAKNNKYAVATQDKLLKQRLKKEGIEVVTLRQKKYLLF